MSTADEMETGRKRNEYFANLGKNHPQPKTDPTGEGGSVAPIDTSVTAAVTAKHAQADGEREMPLAERSAAPKVAVTAPNVVCDSPPAEQPSETQLGVNASQASSQRGGISKPIPIRPEFANFPAELKLLPNWVLWRYLPPKSDGGKWPKVPFQPNGKTASTTDRSTWSRFEVCCAAYARGGFDGVGFVFDGAIGADGLCYCGVDLDSCIEKGNQLHSLARSRIERLDTYTERSVSGTGVHCIARAQPLGRIVKFDGVEIYTKARYFTFTGRSFGEIKTAPTRLVRSSRKCGPKKPWLSNNNNPACPLLTSRTLLRTPSLLRLLPCLMRGKT